MSYDAIGQMTEIDRYNSGTLTSEVSHTTISYDGSGNMTGETDYVSGGTITYSYAYDDADRITSEVRKDISTTVTTAYDYDLNSEVTGVAVNDTATATYSYDANGNRDMEGYSTTGAGDNNEISTDGTWTYTYDAAGNVTEMSMGTSADTWFFTYNLDNQVTSAKEYAAASTTSTLLTEIDYGYDVFGDMISRTQTVSGTMTTDYAYDVSHASIGISAQVNPLYAELSSGTITERYLYDGNGNLAARTGSDTDGTAWLLTDYQGSVREILNAGGSLEGSVTYDAYGNITSETSASCTGDMAFQGMMLDRTTGFNEAKYRFELPDGQWTAQDPLGLGPDVNDRREMGNDATDAVDPSGLLDNYNNVFPANPAIGDTSTWTNTSFVPTGTGNTLSNQMVIVGRQDLVQYSVINKTGPTSGSITTYWRPITIYGTATLVYTYTSVLPQITQQINQIQAAIAQIRAQIAAKQDQINVLQELGRLAKEANNFFNGLGLGFLLFAPFALLSAAGASLLCLVTSYGFKQGADSADATISTLNDQINSLQGLITQLNAETSRLQKLPTGVWKLTSITNQKATAWDYYGDNTYSKTTMFGPNYRPAAQIEDGTEIDDPTTIRWWYKGVKVPWIYSDNSNLQNLEFLGE